MIAKRKRRDKLIVDILSRLLKVDFICRFSRNQFLLSYYVSTVLLKMFYFDLV